MDSDKPGAKMKAAKAYQVRTGCTLKQAKDILLEAWLKKEKVA